jgi:hypothetical protein
METLSPNGRFVLHCYGIEFTVRLVRLARDRSRRVVAPEKAGLGPIDP